MKTGFEKIEELVAQSNETEPEEGVEPSDDTLEPVPSIANPITFKVDDEAKLPPRVPIRYGMVNGKSVYHASIFGGIYDIGFYVQLISLLETADENTIFVLSIGSPGGSVSVGSIISSAIVRSKATVIGVAVGDIASISMHIWSVCDKHSVMEGAVCLFHMSSHGDFNISTLVEQKAKELIYYVSKYLLGVSVAKGHLLPEELEIIQTESKDIILSVKVMLDRIKDSESYISVDELLEVYGS